MATEPWVFAVIISCSFIGAIGQYFFKKASATISFNILNFIKNKYVYFGIGIYSIGTVIWLLILPYGDLSVIYPFVAIVYIWVALVSKKFLNEKMNIWKWLGILSIVLGVALVGLGA
ncbi:hypothetical protein KY312_03895 [Candidatus Woesearchaeota archaeon]|nr:hypothetical protein [Candidatus Woesearchaeota archaeon]